MLDLKLAGIAGVIALALGGIATVTAYEKLIVPGRLADERTAVTKLVTESVTATVTAERDAACLVATSEGERQARLAAEKRHVAAIDQALLAYQQAAEQSAAQTAAEIAALNSEIRTYESRLKELGRSCPLGPDDYRFIYGDGVQLP